MMKDLKVILENRPGTLAELSEALGEAGINIEGICGFAQEVSGGVAHILVDDSTPALRALKLAGIKIEEEREAVVVDMKDRPSELAAVARRMSDSGINIEFFYTATRTRMVLGVADTQKAYKLLEVKYAPA